MSDLVLSGFVGVGIQMAINQILHHINIAIRYRNELESLNELLLSLQDINSALQKIRLALTSGQLNSSHQLIPLSVNNWLKKLDMLLQQASEMVQQCTVAIPGCDVFSRYRMSKRITRCISRIKEHRENVASIGITIQLVQSVNLLQPLNISDTTVSRSSAAPLREGMKYIEEPLIVGQDTHFSRLEKLLQNSSRIGVVGMGGEGKTLILKRLYNSHQMMFGGRGSILLEELGVPLPAVCNSSLIIVSSRNRSALLEMGVADSSIVQMQQLMDDDSWQLFLSHAFPHNDGNIPTTVDEETARGICRECGGLPLAVKVTGRTMASITTSEGWEVALKKMQNADFIHERAFADSLYGSLRLSYDALADLGLSLQLCFLYLAAFMEDEVINTKFANVAWFTEGLLDRHDPLQQGQAYVDALANRCLIEPVIKDTDGRVIRFRVDDVLYNLARQIAEKEENCFFCSGRGLQEFPANDCSGKVRIALRENRLRCVPNTFRGAHICSLVLAGNTGLKEIPKQVIGSMTSLRVLDLSYTSLLSLPENIGCLKHLVSLMLTAVPITRLPNSITALKNLQMLHLSKTEIRSLPSNIHNLSSLRTLNVSECKHLQSLPYKISHLNCMQFLTVTGSPNTWLKKGPNKGNRRPLLINDLGALSQLKLLQLSNYGETNQEGMLGSMTQMESLYLKLTEMESLPHDITGMSKLKTVTFECPQLIKLEHSFCGLQCLRYIKFYGCSMLKELPELHKLVSLKQLDIVRCSNIEKLPREFGEKGAFPRLEILSLAQLDKLEELPVVEEEAMPSLKTFSIVQCEELQILSESYWSLKKVAKIRIYGCSTVANRIMQENHTLRRREVETVTISRRDTIVAMERTHKIVKNHKYRWHGELHREIRSNEHLLFLYQTFYEINI